MIEDEGVGHLHHLHLVVSLVETEGGVVGGIVDVHVWVEVCSGDGEGGKRGVDLVREKGGSVREGRGD